MAGVGVSIACFTVFTNLDLGSPDITWNFVNTQIWTGVESHVGIICACLPSLRPLLNLLLFGSIDRNHRRDPSDRKRPGGPSARSYDIWGAHLKNHQIGQGNKAREMTDRESGCGYTQLSYEEHKEGTSISATNLELDDMHADQGIQVRTDVYIDGYGKK